MYEEKYIICILDKHIGVPVFGRIYKIQFILRYDDAKSTLYLDLNTK